MEENKSMDVEMELTQEMVCNMCHEHYNQGIVCAATEIKNIIEENSNDLEKVVKHIETMIADAKEAEEKTKEKITILTNK